MASKTDEQKILEWAERQEHADPAWWKHVMSMVTQFERVPPQEARKRVIERLIADCKPEKYGVPQEIQWRGTENKHDRECKRCEVLKTGGKLRYLGYQCLGTTKITKCWYDEDVEICGDVEVSEYLHCWRCEVCGNEYTDDWFLE